MLHAISATIAALLIQNKSDVDQQETCAYGIETALYTLLSSAFLLLVGYCFSALLQTVILIAIYYANQTVGGGYHANSHLSCLVSMLSGLLICLFLLSLHIPDNLFALSFLSFGYLLSNPLHLHPNKSHLQENAQQFIFHSRIISTASMLLLLALFQFQSELSSSVSLGLIVSSVSRYIGTKVN